MRNQFIIDEGKDISVDKKAAISKYLNTTKANIRRSVNLITEAAPNIE